MNNELKPIAGNKLGPTAHFVVRNLVDQVRDEYDADELSIYERGSADTAFEMQNTRAPSPTPITGRDARIAELEKLRGDIEPIIGFGPHPAFRIINDRIALLREQGEARADGQQEWISVDNVRSVETQSLVLELLRRHGYAKGGYVNKCKSCGKESWWMDKLAWTCLECAQHNVNDILYSITNDPPEPPPFPESNQD